MKNKDKQALWAFVLIILFTMFFSCCSEDNVVNKNTPPISPIGGTWALTINSLTGSLHLQTTGNSLGGYVTFVGYTGQSSLTGSYDNDSVHVAFPTWEVVGSDTVIVDWHLNGIYDNDSMNGLCKVIQHENDSLWLTANWSATKTSPIYFESNNEAHLYNLLKQ